MRLTKWRIVLIIAALGIAIPIAAHVSSTQTAFIDSAEVDLYQPTVAHTEVKVAAYNSTTSAGHRATPVQTYYDRRRRYLERRVERRADYLEEEDGNDDDSADSDDGRDSNDSASDDDDEGDSMDQEDELIERRREYLRERLDRNW